MNDIKEFDYYKDKEFLTNSMLGWLEVSSAFFKKMFDEYPKEDEDGDQYMGLGSAFHVLELESRDFNSRYVVLDLPAPTNIVQKKFIETLILHHTTDDFTKQDLIDAYKLVYSTNGKSPKTIEAASLKLYEDNKSYIDYLLNKDERITISNDTYARLVDMDKALKSNWKACELILDNYMPDGYKSYNEHTLFFEFHGVKMKSKIDRILVNYKTGHIILVDLKTNSLKSTRHNYIEQLKKDIIEEFNYDRQLALYRQAIYQNINSFDILVHDGDIHIDIFIVAVQTNITPEARVLKISEDTYKNGLQKAEILIEKYKVGLENDFNHDDWYFTNKDGYITI